MSRFCFLILFSSLLFSCQDNAVSSANGESQLRLSTAESAYIVVKDNHTGEEQRIGLNGGEGDVIAFRIEERLEDDTIPTFQEIVGGMIGGKNSPAGSQGGKPSYKLGDKTLILEDYDGSQLMKSRVQFQWQDPRHLELQKLRKNEKLDELVKGSKTDLELFFRLQNWCRKQWEISEPNPYPIWNANVILSEIRSGKTGGFCGQYSQVLSQALTSFGYSCRYLWLKNHFALEVYSNSLNKWIALDPLANAVYKRGELYLSAMEIYEALNGKGDLASIVAWNTASETVIEGGAKIKTFAECVYDLKNTHLGEREGGLFYVNNYWLHSVVYADANITAYDFNGKLPLMTPNKRDIYFPMNQCSYEVRALNQGAGVAFMTLHLNSNMPFLKGFQLSKDGGKSWFATTQQFRLKVKEGLNDFRFRSVNVLGVTGVEKRLAVSLK